MPEIKSRLKNDLARIICLEGRGAKAFSDLMHIFQLTKNQVIIVATELEKYIIRKDNALFWHNDDLLFRFWE